MIFRTSLVRCSKPIFSGPSVKAHYDQTLQKLNLGLTGHVAGGALMLISSSAFGASPFTTALFAGILWMQVMSTAKVTEIGGWVNLCKNVIAIERLTTPGESAELSTHVKWLIRTDASELRIETEPKSDTANALPTLKELRELGVLHVDSTALLNSDPLFQELFNRDDLVVNANESMKPTMEPPPGAAKTSIPKLAEIYQRRQKAIQSGNSRLASVISNARPMDPVKMLDRLGTAAIAMGGAVFVLGGTVYFASTSFPKPTVSNPPKAEEHDSYALQ